MTFSVIVPVYNTQKYLKECLDSILSQTYKDFEIILVDDGSTDESGKICDEAAKNDNRVNVIHKKNGGVSSARNAGIAIAKGSYLAFVDSDDFVAPLWLEHINKEAQKNNCDIICYMFAHNGTCNNIKKSGFVAVGADELKNNFNDIYNISIGAVWTQVYKSDLIKNNKLMFNTGIVLNEETFFNLEYYKKINSFQFINETYYYYRKVENSSSRKGNTEYLKIVKEKVRVYTNFLNDMQYADIAHKKPQDMLQDGVYAYFLQAAISTNELNYKQRVKILKEVYFNKENYNVLMSAKRFKATSVNLLICKVSAILKMPFIIAGLSTFKKYFNSI